MISKKNVFVCNDSSIHLTEQKAALHEIEQLKTNFGISLTKEGISLNGSLIDWKTINSLKYLYDASSISKEGKLKRGNAVRILDDLSNIGADNVVSLPYNSNIFRGRTGTISGKSGALWRVRFPTVTNGYISSVWPKEAFIIE